MTIAKKTETPVVKTPEIKKEAVKAPEAKKEAVKAPETKKVAAKATETKKAPAKKPAAKKPAAKKETAPKAAAVKVVLEYQGRQVSADDILSAVMAKAGKAKKVEVYVKPEDGAAYYVADGESGKVEF